MATFLRLLRDDDKASALGEALAAEANGERDERVFYVNPSSFSQVPNTPFCYWAPESIRRKFTELPPFEGEGRTAVVGLQTSDDPRFVRASWEVAPERMLRMELDEWVRVSELSLDSAEYHEAFVEKTHRGARWVPFAKGGEYSPYYADIHLVVNWKKNGEEIRNFEKAFIRNEQYYFRSGLTWPRRTQSGLGLRVIPASCIFADKGPTAFIEGDEPPSLLSLLAITTSESFRYLVELQMVFGSYEVGVIQRTPVLDLDEASTVSLSVLARRAWSLKRTFDTVNETSNAFVLHAALSGRVGAFDPPTILRELADIQRDIDDIAFRQYGLGGENRDAIERWASKGAASAGVLGEEAEKDRVAVEEHDALLSWCVGVVFGRWDMRIVLDPSLAPKLQDPFDPLPVCSPGMLVGTDGLPAKEGHIASDAWMRARRNVLDVPNDVPDPSIPDDDYPLNVDWDGILVDDEGHEDDIVLRVRDVLELIWGDRAEDIEKEVCETLGVKSIRDYFRNPRLFFESHIKRYSKSRRKAPIYWLLQSERRNYALWVYYHRLDRDTIHKAFAKYVTPKINHETNHLAELRERASLANESGERREFSRLEREVERSEELVSELKRFREALERVAAMGYEPDLDDGVVLNIAPLHEVVPWKESEKYWKELLAGKHEWSTISQRLREKGAI